MKLEQERLDRAHRAHRANRPRPGASHSRKGTAKPLNARNACAGTSANIGPPTSREPSATARSLGNAPTDSVPFANVGASANTGPQWVPPPHNKKIWQYLNAMKLEQERMARAHRANRPRFGGSHARRGTARPLSARNACAGISPSTGPSASTEPPASRGPSTTARPVDNAGAPTGGGPFANVKPSGSPSLSGSPSTLGSPLPSGKASASGIGAQHHANPKASDNDSGPRMKPSPNETEFSHLCWICRWPFQISSGIKDNWKCFHQPPFIGKDGNFLPAQITLRRLRLYVRNVGRGRLSAIAVEQCTFQSLSIA
ncbi:hypothetical protein N7523_010285 [Penicillium sp. IBT 18751x]|nr:hypothetical protein N7523_010285 [Penicillium sp. IBT 18751x]